MLRYLLFSIGATLLLGCQASNPYQAQGLPLPAAPANAATHFDNSAYPAVTANKTYTYWCWNEHSTQSLYSDATQSVERQALAEQLEQYAFRPASSSNPCELKISINSQYGQQTQGITGAAGLCGDLSGCGRSACSRQPFHTAAHG